MPPSIESRMTKKSPWIILLMGLGACIALAIMSHYYMRQSPTVRLRAGLQKEFDLSDVSVAAHEKGYTVTYSCDPGLAENPKALQRNMHKVAEYVKSRTAVEQVRVIAKISQTDSREYLYPPEPATRRSGGAQPSKPHAGENS